MSDELDAYIVFTSDGVLFRCHVSRTTGALGPPTDIWIFTRSDGLWFVGPRVDPSITPEQMQQLVEEWWTDRKAAGLANSTVATLRAKLRDQDN